MILAWILAADLQDPTDGSRPVRTLTVQALQVGKSPCFCRLLWRRLRACWVALENVQKFAGAVRVGSRCTDVQLTPAEEDARGIMELPRRLPSCAT